MNTQQADLERWLDQAAHGLPADVAALVREEIAAHYDDAYRDYLLEGMNPDDAHRQVMLDLGDVADTAEGFQHIHQADRRYLKAALVGLAYGAGYLVSIPLNERLGGAVGFNPAIFLFVLYILHSFKIIFTDRFSTERFDFYVTLITRGIVVVCVTRLLGWTIFHHPTITESSTRSLWDGMTRFELALNLISLSGLLLVAAGLIVLGERAFHLRHHLYGLWKPVSGGVVACGLALATFGIASSYGMGDLGHLSTVAAVVAGLAACGLSVFIFFRAGTRHEAYTA